MSAHISQTHEWIVDTGTPRNLQKDVEEFEELFSEDQPDGSDEAAEESITSKILHTLSGRAKSGRTKSGRTKSRGITMGSLQSITRVTVIAPGAGVGANGIVYMEMKKDPSLRLLVEGRSGMPYDRYPPVFAQVGNPAPNLESFAQDILSKGLTQDTDCFIFGSRGGQVVLPTLWNNIGDAVPPAIVINGGCAIDIPIKFNWPDTAMTFLLLGGCDYFKKPHVSPQQYVADAQNRVSKSNSTTAILFVQEMAHMPAPALLKAILRPVITGLVSWKATGQVPIACFEMIAKSLKSVGLSVRLLYTCSPGVWQEVGSPLGASRPVASSAQVQLPPNAGIMQMVKPAVAQAPLLVPAGTRPPVMVHQSPVVKAGTGTSVLPTGGAAMLPGLPRATSATTLPAGTATLVLPTGGAAMLPGAPRTTALPARPSPVMHLAGVPPLGRR